MSGQEQALLEILLSEDNYVSYEILAEKMNVSSRTVMRLVKNLESFLENFSIVIVVKKRSGIRLAGTQENVKKLRETLDLEKTVDYTANERVLLILFQLFSAQEYLKTYYLAYLLNVSVGTVNRDLETVRSWLQGNQLKLNTQRGFGLKIEGNIHAIRQAIVNLIQQCVDMQKLAGATEELVFRDIFSGGVKKKLIGFLGRAGLYRTIQLIDSFDYTIRESFVQEDYFQYVLYTHVMLHFSSDVGSLQKRCSNQNLKTHILFSRMCEFAKKVEKEECVCLTEEDICDLLSVYLSMRRKESLFSVYKYDEDIKTMTLELLEDIETDLQRPLISDELLVERLSAHLNLMFDRLYLGTMIDNSNLPRLKQEYPQIFEVVKKNVDQFGKRHGVDINENEISYIMLHVLAPILNQESEKQKIRAVVLCMSGIETSKILTQKIQSRFPQIEIIQECSKAEFRETDFLQCGVELIITTIQIDILLFPHVMVSPWMEEWEFNKLSSICQEIMKKKLKECFQRPALLPVSQNPYMLEEALRELNDMEQILKSYSLERVQAESVEQAMESVAVKMFTEKENRQEFLRLVKERKTLGGTVLAEEGILLLHCRMRQEVWMKVIVFEQPIDFIFEDRMIKLQKAVVLVAPREAEEGLIKLFSSISAAFVQNPRLIQAVQQENEKEIFKLIGLEMSREIF